MKRFIKKQKWDLLLLFCFCFFLIITHLTALPFGISAEKNFIQFLIEMAGFMPAMFILVGLFDVWFPREKVEKHIGRDSGVFGMFWVILLAMLQAGPLYGAFPVACLLWKKGASIKNVFIYIGAFATIKIPMLTFEIGFLGLKFSLIRTALTLPVFIFIGFLMEWILKKQEFSIKQPE